MARTVQRLRLGLLLRSVTGATRGAALSVAAAALAARLAIVLVARSVAQGDTRDATLLGAVTAGLWLAQRGLAANARVSADSDLYRAASRAVLAADVLGVPKVDLSRALFVATGNARAVLVQIMPALVADAAALVVVVPLLTGALPARVLLLALAAFVVVVGVLLALRRRVGQLQSLLFDAHQRVVDDLLVSIEGRLEIAARGAEAEHRLRLDSTLAAFARLSRRAGLAAALLGRIPLAAGAAVVLGVVLSDARARDELTAAVLGQAILLGAAAPVFFGLLAGAMALFRSGPELAPLGDVLEAEPRPETIRATGERATLPATFEVEGVSFAYELGAPEAVREVSFVWPHGRPLVLTGENGAGKSTLLRLLIGLRPPSRGAIRLAGRPLEALDLVALRAEVALLPQRPYLGEGYRSVREAMQLARPSASDEDMRAALSRVCVLRALSAGRSDPLAAPVGELSAGQRQRVALARVLLQRARLVLLDEPDANLDAAGVALVRALVEEMSARGAMVAIAAHTPELAAMDAVRVELTRV